MDLVSDEEVGVMRGMGALVFWALLSMSAVVVNSYRPTSTSSIEVAQAQTPSAPKFPVQAFGPGATASPAVVVAQPSAVPSPPVVYPKGYVLPPPDLMGKAGPLKPPIVPTAGRSPVPMH